MDWKKGFSASYYATIVDPDTWKDIDRFEIIGGTIQRSISDLRCSADITCKQHITNETLIRVWLDAKQNSNSSHTPLFTGYAASPERKINGMRTEYTLQCYSILRAAEDILLDRGWYAPAEVDAATIIKKLLAVTKAPIIFENGLEPKQLKNAIIAQSGESNLSMADWILTAVGWRMKILGDGSIFIGEYASEESVRFDSISNDVIEPSLSITHDWYNVPNVIRAVLDDTVAIYKDENINNPYSIPNRGREVWIEDDSPALNKDETLAQYAERILSEEQAVATEVSYDRRFHPDIYPTDFVRLNYPAQDLTGVYLVISQTVNLGFNARTSEEVRLSWAIR